MTRGSAARRSGSGRKTPSDAPVAPAAPRPRGRPRLHTDDGRQAVDLRAQMLSAARRLLDADGIEAVTVRAVARSAGVSHAAPQHHFGSLQGLLTELAAQGYAEFSDALGPTGGAFPDVDQGVAYVRFAVCHPNLFLLMFRSAGLDWSNPALCAASDSAFARLGPSGTVRPAGGHATGRQSHAGAWDTMAALVRPWVFVHGFAMLLIDRRLDPVLRQVSPAGQPAEPAPGPSAGQPSGRQPWEALLRACLVAPPR